jgi:HlyD family secretion protein
MTTTPIRARLVELRDAAARAAAGRRPRWLLAGVAALGVVVVALGALGLVRGRGGGPDAGDYLTYTVQPMDLRLTVLESGTLQSRSSVNVLSQVEERVPIIALVAEGSRVKAGDPVVELDSSALNTRRTEQLIVVEKARAALSQAQQAHTVAISQAESNVRSAELAMEFAQLDRKKYLEGEYPQQERLLQGELAIAEVELNLAKVKLRFSEELAAEGYLSDEELGANRAEVKRAEYKLEAARLGDWVLREFTHPRMLRDLDARVAEAERAMERARRLADADLEQARTNLLAQEATLQIEESKRRHVEAQIDHCTMRAPQDGVVVYPVPPDEDLVDLFIKEGAIIRLRQHVFSIPDTEVLQVTTSVHEAMVNRVRPGLPARVWVDVLPDTVFTGRVAEVSPLPNPEDWRRTTAKYYETIVSLDGQSPRLRPGMSARVEILIGLREGVTAVPVQSVIQKGRLGVCYVRKGGRADLRRVELGDANDQHVEVRSGLEAGERVVLAPDQIGVPVRLLQELETRQETASAQEPVALLAAQVEAAAPAPLELEYKGVLLGDAPGVAEVEIEIVRLEGATIKTEVDLKVQGGPPGATWEVVVDGFTLGTVELDPTGAAEKEWSTKDGTLPEGFPAGAGEGSTVSLGGVLWGTLGP